MSYPLVERQPPTGAQAFQVVDEIHCQSQAAVLLMVANRLRGDDEILASLTRLASPAGQPLTVPAQDDDEFPIPHFRAGFAPVRLGPRVLRTETASIAALSVLQALWGDLQ